MNESANLPQQPGVGEHPDDVSWLSRNWNRAWRLMVGGPKSLEDHSLFHKVALIPILAWVGMGADGLSSSAYGPEESFKVLGANLYLVPWVVLASVLTIFIISVAYSRVIEHFPSGGGGYVVSSSLLGPHAGLVSGSALIVDYVLTITVSVAAGGDALFSLLPGEWLHYKLGIEAFLLLFLLVMNLRGVKESVLAVAPIFFLFVVTHILLIGASFFLHREGLAPVASASAEGLGHGLSQMGLWKVAGLFFMAYSMGAGTYTGIEAVSNGLNIMREPQVATGKRTMVYMAVSLAIASGGLFLAYLLTGAHPIDGQTMNAVLADRVFGHEMLHGSLGAGLVWATLVSEAGLLVIAAQTGFIDGPRVMANMALDHWFPKRFSALSDRLTMQNGVLLFGLGSLAALFYTHGNTGTLVVMYSINVFITFSMTELSMTRMYWKKRHVMKEWLGKIYIHVIGLTLCSSILVLMISEKFMAGGWVTLAVTCCLIALCIWIQGYYRRLGARMRRLDEQLMDLPLPEGGQVADPDPTQPTAIFLVERYGSVGIHTFFSATQLNFPGYFKNAVFLSVGEIDSGAFKGAEAMKGLEATVNADLSRYSELARRAGMPSACDHALGTDLLSAATDLCVKTAQKYPRSVVFGGQLIFQKERWYQRFMHNQTVFALQRRLQWEGLPMTVMPVRVFG